MLTLSFRSISCAALAIVLLAGCDRESADNAQPQENQTQENQAQAGAAETGKLGGTLERAFAGQPIPAVTVTDPAGTKLDLAKTGGKPVLLNLWATWCAPCVVEMPLLDDLAGELGGSVRVVTVSEDMNGAAAVKPFFAAKGFRNLPQWMDTSNDLAFAFGGGAVLPLTVLYDSEGKEVWRMIGGYNWGSAEARELVAEGLNPSGQ